MIKVENLSLSYPGHPVLSGVNLSIPAGKITVIVGPNGCGKSTFLKALVGICPCDSGTILVDGQNISRYSTKELARKVAYLAQNRQVPDISVLRMVLHGRFPYLSYPRRYKKEDFSIAYEAMEQMGIEDLAEEPLNALSGGTRQKVYIAVALAQDTPAILLDEPTTFLDVAHQLQMMEHARFLAEKGKAVVMVLHDLSMAMQTADQLAVMAEGRLLRCGEPEMIFDSGCLDSVFGIRVCRFQTPEGWQYYYQSNHKRA